ncbi:15691_t:CDS:2, partial [Acaulospora morrowiae]
YLALTVATLLKDVTMSCAIFRGSYDLLRPREQIKSHIYFFIAWIVIPVLYARYLLGSLGSIPLMCLADPGSYSKQQLGVACTIRKFGFLLMISYAGIFGFSVLIVIMGIIRCCGFGFSEKSFRPLVKLPEESFKEDKKPQQTLHPQADVKTTPTDD